MKRMLKRAWLAWSISGLEAELECTRERFYTDCERLSVLRAKITAEKRRLAAIDGHQASVHQLRAR